MDWKEALIHVDEGWAVYLQSSVKFSPLIEMECNADCRIEILEDGRVVMEMEQSVAHVILGIAHMLSEGKWIQSETNDEIKQTKEKYE